MEVKIDKWGGSGWRSEVGGWRWQCMHFCVVCVIWPSFRLTSVIVTSSRHMTRACASASLTSDSSIRTVVRETLRRSFARWEVGSGGDGEWRGVAESGGEWLGSNSERWGVVGERLKFK